MEVVLDKLKEYFKDSNYHFVLLFGSYAKQSAKTLSDVDISIYAKNSLSLKDMGLIIYDLEDILGKRVDLVDLNKLYDKNSKLAFNIVSNHKIVTLKNKESYDNFKFYTYKYYFDRKYLYDMFDKALIKRIDSGDFGKVQTS